MDEADLPVHVGRLHRLGRRVSAELHRRVAELDDRRAWTLLGWRSTADWLASTLAMTSYEAKNVVDTARVLGQLPKTAARFAAGELDVAQVQAAAKAHADLERLQSLAEAAAEEADDGAGDADGAGEGLGARGVDDPAGAGAGGGSGGGDPRGWEPIWDRGGSAAEMTDAADAVDGPEADAGGLARVPSATMPTTPAAPGHAPPTSTGRGRSSMRCSPSRRRARIGPRPVPPPALPPA